MNKAPIIDSYDNFLPVMKQEESTEGLDTCDSEVSYCFFFQMVNFYVINKAKLTCKTFF